MSLRGKYIVIEGIDGSGKSTQFNKLIAHLGSGALGVREPGGTPMAEDIRTLLKNKNVPRSAQTNVFLFAAARADIIQTVIRPTLFAGTHVVSDRNWLSSVAYQSAEGARVDDIITLSKIAAGDLFDPDLFILIDVDPLVCHARLANRGNTETDFFDSKGDTYFKKVREAYISYTKEFSHAHIVDGSPSPEIVWQHIKKIIQKAGL